MKARNPLVFSIAALLILTCAPWRNIAPPPESDPALTALPPGNPTSAPSATDESPSPPASTSDPGRAPSPTAVVGPQLTPDQPPGRQSNPLGLMLGAPGMDLGQRIELVQQLGAVYFRPNSLFVGGWRGECLECEAAQRAGLGLVLTVRANGGSFLRPTSPPADLADYQRILGQILDRYRPALLVVENEENSSLFYSGTPEQYALQLAAACQVAHERKISCTNGGLVSTLVALLTYNHYLEIGEQAKAESFAMRAFTPEERQAWGSERVKEQIAKGKSLLALYPSSGADYLNFHWYIDDAAALQESAEFLQAVTGMALLTNEIGQHDDDPETTRALLTSVLDLRLPFVVWFSVDAPKAHALMNPDGSLRESGFAFQDFALRAFPE